MDKDTIASILAGLYVDLSLAQDPTWYPEEGTFETSKENIKKLARSLGVENLVSTEIDEAFGRLAASPLKLERNL